MKVIDHDGEDKDKKLFLMIAGAIAIGAILVAVIMFSFRNQDNVSDTEGVTEAVPDFGTETEAEINQLEKIDTEAKTAQTEMKAFKIEKQEEYITPVLGSFSPKVNDAVRGFVYQNNLSADSAECLDCAVATDDPSCTEFYLQLDDQEKTLVTARYNPERAGVEVSYCVYSLDEIQKAVWMSDNGPAVRDTTEEPIYNNVLQQSGQNVKGTLSDSTELEEDSSYTYVDPTTEESNISFE